MHVLHEPYRTQFATMLRSPEASRDIHDDPQSDLDARRLHVTGATPRVSDEFIRRELDRADMHRRRLIPLLAKVGRAERILDFGCGSGGTTIALALSESLSPSEVIGTDVNAHAVAAARVRAQGCGVQTIAKFRAIEPGRLPFADGAFDLVVAVSVLEFITSASARQDTVEELGRVVRPGGFVFIASPRPSLREYHTNRWLADLRRPASCSWSSSARSIRRWLAGWEHLPLSRELASLEHDTPLGRLLASIPFVHPLFPWATRWNKLLFRRPAPH
jgi:SAM-dependent methyltransferase